MATYSSSKSVSNSGQMSSSSQKSGATGAVKNTTKITSTPGKTGASGTSTSVVRNAGDPGFNWNTDILKKYRSLMGL